MDELWVQAGLVIPAPELSWKAVRGSGPGGQHVNKVSSKVELRFALSTTTSITPEVADRLRNLAAKRLDTDGDIVITSQKTREQHRNLEDARDRLRLLILRALERPKPRKATKPSRAAKEKRLGEKRHKAGKKKLRKVGPLHQD